MIDMNTVTDEQADYMNTPTEAFEETLMLQKNLAIFFPNELGDYLDTDFCERVARRMVWDIEKGFARLPERFRAVAFHHAVLTDDSDVVDAFVRAAKKEKADIDDDFCDPEFNSSPMVRACCNKCRNSFVVLVEKGGASLTAKDELRRSLAFCCLCSNNLPFMKWARKKGVAFDPNDKDDALIPNAGDCSTAVLKWLIDDLGGDVNFADEDGGTALYYAAAAENAKNFRWLVEKGARLPELS